MYGILALRSYSTLLLSLNHPDTLSRVRSHFLLVLLYPSLAPHDLCFLQASLSVLGALLTLCLS